MVARPCAPVAFQVREIAARFSESGVGLFVVKFLARVIGVRIHELSPQPIICDCDSTLWAGEIVIDFFFEAGWAVRVFSTRCRVELTCFTVRSCFFWTVDCDVALHLTDKMFLRYISVLELTSR